MQTDNKTTLNTIVDTVVPRVIRNIWTIVQKYRNRNSNEDVPDKVELSLRCIEEFDTTWNELNEINEDIEEIPYEQEQEQRMQEQSMQEQRMQEQRIQEQRMQEQRIQEQRIQECREREQRIQEYRERERRIQEYREMEQRKQRESEQSENSADTECSNKINDMVKRCGIESKLHRGVKGFGIKYNPLFVFIPDKE
jgi:hypothetical protein